MGRNLQNELFDEKRKVNIFLLFKLKEPIDK